MIEYPKLKLPTGEEVRDFRLAMNWSLQHCANVAFLYDAQAFSDVERGKRKLNQARWTLLLLAAGKHPTLQVQPVDAAQAPEAATA